MHGSDSWTSLLTKFAEEIKGAKTPRKPSLTETWSTGLDYSECCIRAMVQFRQYGGLTWSFHEDSEKRAPDLVVWVEALREYLDRDKIGLRVPVSFVGEPYKHGMKWCLPTSHRY
jgi:hypothetical protein